MLAKFCQNSTALDFKSKFINSLKEQLSRENIHHVRHIFLYSVNHLRVVFKKLPLNTCKKVNKIPSTKFKFTFFDKLILKYLCYTDVLNKNRIWMFKINH